MRTAIARTLGCEVPIFAFSHCRDVVVEVTKAGGFGVLGASTFAPDLLEQELRWIDDHVGGLPYGVDVLIPTTYDRAAEAEGLGGDPERLIPDGHRAFMEKILLEAGVPPLPDDERTRVHREIVEGRGNMTPDGARAAAGGGAATQAGETGGQRSGRPAGRCGVRSARTRRDDRCAVRQGVPRPSAIVRPAVELLIAQGTEAGGHTGAISTFVLVPQVVAACPDIPVLAAGGVTGGSHIAAALALGAQGVWCGTVWLGTRESELTPFEKTVLFEARAEDAIRSRVRTGKPVRMMRSKMSDAWEKPDAPRLSSHAAAGILYNEVHARVVRAQRSDLYSFPVGQGVGMMREETSVREVMLRMQTEYLDVTERLAQLDADP